MYNNKTINLVFFLCIKIIIFTYNDNTKKRSDKMNESNLIVLSICTMFLGYQLAGTIKSAIRYYKSKGGIK